MVDEIAFAMKSCFAGLYLDGFDFIQGTHLGFHLSEAKISSLLATISFYKRKRENISATNRFVLSFCRYKDLLRRTLLFAMLIIRVWA